VQISLAKGLDPGLDLRRYETLLEITDLLVRSQDLAHFFVSMSERLREIAAAEFVGFALHEPARNVLQMYPWHGGELAPAPIEKSVEGTASGWTWQNQQPLVISDLESDTRFPATLQLLRDRGLRSHCWLPLTTAQKKLGTLGLGSGQLNAYADNDVGFLLRVVLPNARFSPRRLLEQYQSLSSAASLVARAQYPTYAARLSAVL